MRWSEVEAAAPDLATRARAFFDALTHKTLATLRADGSPRISGSECIFAEGDLWFGSMRPARKASDLLRDARFAFHSGSPNPDTWTGDAKVSGRAEEVTDASVLAAVLGSVPTEPMYLFRADITELAVVELAPTKDKLIIESWHMDRGLSRHER